MPYTPNNADHLLVLAQICDIDIPDHILAAVRSAPQDSKLKRWVERVNNPISHNNRRRIQSTLRGDVQADEMGGTLDVLPQSELERVTRRLDKSSHQFSLQSGMLMTQQTLLSTYTAERSKSQGKLHSTDSRKTIGEAQSTRVLNEAKFHDFSHEIQTRLDTLNKDAKSLPATVSVRLKADDRILEVLCKDSHDSVLDVDTPKLSALVQQLASILQATRVSSLKDRLDRVYLRALTDTRPPELALVDAAEAIPELKLDIQSLYTEIDDVVAMTVGEEHGNRLQKGLAGIGLKQQHEVAQALQDTGTRIARLTAQLSALTSQINRVQCQRLALSELLGYTAETTPATLHKTAQSAQVSPEMELSSAGTVEAKASALESSLQDLFDSASLRRTVFSITEALNTARLQRAEAVGLLRAVEKPTDTALLDALDGRIASTSKAFDQIAHQSH